MLQSERHTWGSYSLWFTSRLFENSFAPSPPPRPSLQSKRPKEEVHFFSTKDDSLNEHHRHAQHQPSGYSFYNAPRSGGSFGGSIFNKILPGWAAMEHPPIEDNPPRYEKDERNGNAVIRVDARAQSRAANKARAATLPISLGDVRVEFR